MVTVIGLAVPALLRLLPPSVLPQCARKLVIGSPPSPLGVKVTVASPAPGPAAVLVTVGGSGLVGTRSIVSLAVLIAPALLRNWTVTVFVPPPTGTVAPPVVEYGTQVSVSKTPSTEIRMSIRPVWPSEAASARLTSRSLVVGAPPLISTDAPVGALWSR